MLYHAEDFSAHSSSDVGMLCRLVTGSSVAVVEKVFDVFGHLADVEVSGVEGAELVVATEVGTFTALMQQVETECVVVVIVGQHAHEGGEEVDLQR